MVVLSHPNGNQNVRGALRGLLNKNLLSHFITTVGFGNDCYFVQYMPNTIRRELSRRIYPIPGNLIKTDPLCECIRLLATRCKWNSLTRHQASIFSVDSIYLRHDQTTAEYIKHMVNLESVYAYEGGARLTFREAKKKGTKCIYELPTGYWKAGRDIFLEEALRTPEWAPTLTGLKDSDEKLARKDEEISEADIVLVASSFTLSTLKYSPIRTRHVNIIPYGAPALGPVKNINRNKPLRLIFVGSLRQQKGLSYLFDTVDLLGSSVTLTLIGMPSGDRCKILEDRLKQHRYITTLPHSEVLREMQQHDIFIFPSLFEGFGLVLLEAMAQGLPIITTTNTGAPDIIKDGCEGFITPIRSPQVMADKIQKLISDRNLLEEMSLAARKKAGQLTWEQYGRNICAAIQENNI